MDNINSLIRKTTDIDVPGAAQLNLKDSGKNRLPIHSRYSRTSLIRTNREFQKSNPVRTRLNPDSPGSPD